MDIVSRLKTFINYLNIPVTQFADTCSIPRPTLSQLLNGRNKKVSDELIGKIHEAFPQLSVLWLMFGEGDMLHEKNNEISDAGNGGIFDFPTDKCPNNEYITPSIDFGSVGQEMSAEKFDSASLATDSRDPLPNSAERAPESTGAEQLKETSSTISFQADRTKKIVNIIVYYNDNSFESFVPNPSGKS